MFSNLIFLILVLLLIDFAPLQLGKDEIALFDPLTGFIAAIGIYFILIAGIFFQNKLLHRFLRQYRQRMLLLVNIELLAFIFCYYFVFWAQRIFGLMPYLGMTVSTLTALTLYLGGLAVFHMHSRSPSGEIRLIIPFAIPFVLFVLVFDLLQISPSFQGILQNGVNSLVMTVLLFIGIILFLAMVMILFPYCLQKIWLCKPLHNPPLEEHLTEICQRAHFKHGGFKSWTILDYALTAAIIGVVPPFRYILFTKKLIKELPPTSIGAILAHEIGHSTHKHLMIYPLIFFGMAAALGLYNDLVSPSLMAYLESVQHIYTQWPWNFLIYPAAAVLPFLAISGLYFRYIFGYFSRLFERQADLNVFVLDIPSKYLIDALRHVGIATGTSHAPNWHHYSIQQRIDYLHRVELHPQLLKEHALRVRLSLIAYVCILATIVWFLL